MEAFKRMRVFPTFSQASEYVTETYDAETHPVRVWARDCMKVESGTGNVKKSKSFPVASLRDMWEILSWLDPSNRIFYEMTLKMSDFPRGQEHACRSRVFMDLEFSRPDNPHVQMSDEEVIEKTLSRFDVFLEKMTIAKAIEHRVLNSSNEEKFSAHVITRVAPRLSKMRDCDERFFRTAFDAGSLMRQWEYEANNDPDMQDLYFIHPNGSRIFVADMSVYTEHRQFRMVGCTKIEENRPLLWNGQGVFDMDEWRKFLIHDDQVQTSGEPIDVPELVSEKDNIVQPISSSAVYRDSDDGSCIHRVSQVEHRQPTTTLVKKVSKTVSAPTLKSRSSEHTDDIPFQFNGHDTIVTIIVRFAESKIKASVTRAMVRRSAPNLLVLATDTRDCPFAGRIHRGNHLYLVFNLLTQKLVLKCHRYWCTGDQVIDLPESIEKQAHLIFSVAQERGAFPL